MRDDDADMRINRGCAVVVGDYSEMATAINALF